MVLMVNPFQTKGAKGLRVHQRSVEVSDESEGLRDKALDIRTRVFSAGLLAASLLLAWFSKARHPKGDVI